jgi:RNA polymerase sigma-70 factor (ECF subfamily)
LARVFRQRVETTFPLVRAAGRGYHRRRVGLVGTEREAEGACVMTYCIVPRELALKLHEPLRDFFADDPAVEVIVERRRRERRGPDGRRAPSPRSGSERRVVHNAGGRRVADRRATVAPVEGPEALPRKVRHHAGRLVWVERIEPATEQLADVDSARLVIRFQAGEAEAFGDLYLRYFDRVYSYLRVLFRSDPHQAEDVAQQVFTKVFEALPRYERRGHPFRAWLFAIARNEAVTQLARAGRSEATDPLEVAFRLDARGEAQPHPEALEWLTDRELMMFVERLPLAQRQVLVLRYMLDLTTREIAEILGRSLEDVRKLDSRARAFLEQRLSAIGKAPRGARERHGWRRMRSPAPVMRMRRHALSSR